MPQISVDVAKTLGAIDVQQQQKYAVKIIRTPEEELIEVAYEEYKLLKSIEHVNIVKMHDAFYNQAKSTMFLVMDLVQGCTIKEYFEK